MQKLYQLLTIFLLGYIYYTWFYPEEALWHATIFILLILPIILVIYSYIHLYLIVKAEKEWNLIYNNVHAVIMNPMFWDEKTVAITLGSISAWQIEHAWKYTFGLGRFFLNRPKHIENCYCDELKNLLPN